MVRDDGTISYPSVLSILGRDHEQTWREKAHDQVARVNNTMAERSTFGGSAAAQTFASVYGAALAEYTATLRGAQADLVTAAENLARAAEEMRNHDEDAGAAFVTLLGRWADPEGFQSSRNQEQARDSVESQEGATAMAALAPEGAPTGTGDGGPGSGPGADPSATPTGSGEPSTAMGTGPSGPEGSDQPAPGTDGPA